jgi:hypothetical protein
MRAKRLAHFRFVCIAAVCIGWAYTTRTLIPKAYGGPIKKPWLGCDYGERGNATDSWISPPVWLKKVFRNRGVEGKMLAPLDFNKLGLLDYFGTDSLRIVSFGYVDTMELPQRSDKRMWYDCHGVLVPQPY